MPKVPPPVRLIRHEAVPACGSFEVRFADGRPSVFFYWDDVPGRRMRPEQMDQRQALAAARRLARSEAGPPGPKSAQADNSKPD